MNAVRTPRENLMLTVGLAVLVTMIYSFWRLNPSSRFGGSLASQVQAERDRIATLQGEIAKAQTAVVAPPGDPAALQQQSDELARQLAEIEAKIELAESEFAIDDLERQAQNVAIAQLAAECLVKIESAKPMAVDESSRPAAIADGAPRPPEVPPPPPTPPGVAAAKAAPPAESKMVGPFIDRKKLADRFDRPLQEMSLIASFEGHRAFLHGLADLELRASVLHYELERVPEPNETLPPLLRATLILLQ